MPAVLPQLIKLKDAISDPEARAMAERATAEVQKAAGAGAEPRLADEAVAKSALTDLHGSGALMMLASSRREM